VTLRRELAIVAGVVITAGVITQLFWPLYPTRKRLCTLISERRTEVSRWESPHEGAVLVVRGTLHGGPEGMYFMTTNCPSGEGLAAVSVPTLLVAGLHTRRTLASLENPDWKQTERSAPFTLLVRVDSEVMSCFGPGLVLTAIAAQGEGRVVVKTKLPRAAA
jgi:hypothetical protein